MLAFENSLLWAGAHSAVVQHVIISYSAADGCWAWAGLLLYMFCDIILFGNRLLQKGLISLS